MNELEWLERYYKNSIDETRLRNIFYFTLVWNVFEKECCDNFAKIKKHPKFLAESLHSGIKEQIVNEVFEYFKNRYFPNGSIDEKFQTFQFGRDEHDGKEHKDFVQEKLLNNNSSQKDKIQSLLYITFRLRNNLYHGIKDVSKLDDEQNENFKQINLFLMEVVDKKS